MLDTHTWDQLSLMARGIVRYDMDRLNMVLGPIASALGVDYKPADVTAGGGAPVPGKRGKATEIDRADDAAVKRAEQRDAGIMMGLQRMGIPVRDE